MGIVAKRGTYIIGDEPEEGDHDRKPRGQGRVCWLDFCRTDNLGGRLACGLVAFLCLGVVSDNSVVGGSDNCFAVIEVNELATSLE